MLNEKGNYILQRRDRNNFDTYYNGHGSWDRRIKKAYVYKTLKNALNALDRFKNISDNKELIMFYNIIKCN